MSSFYTMTMQVLQKLGGDGNYVHMEDIAYNAWKDHPAVFGWSLERYNYPHTLKVVESLKTAQKKGYTTHNKGMWMLTPKGIKSLQLTPHKLQSKQLGEVRRSKLFQMYKRNKISWDEEFLFRDILNVSPDSSTRVANAELQSLLVKATKVGDDEVVQFLRKCANRFESVVGSKE
jgi:GrpB-like predicted nucleotidyltransferase (UPF0157 family)